MHLKSLTVKGFKSFPDRTQLDFGTGVSVIVGPNGSGKSNVTDAVLWALGEQSPLAVRGQSMQDVIFAGAPGRKAASSAEVELVLDDSQGLLGMGPEISIVRRLDRNGEGEYRLAGARCRLVDIIELLSDTGMGKEMHSVISQGRVEAIVTSKPRDRRMLIEEAAGLGKHRKRRRRAQLKLVRTQENLDRALDVEREARSRLRPLKRQAEAAEQHERLERQLLETRWELARDALLGRQRGHARAREAAEAAHRRRADVEQELGGIAARRQRAEEALSARSLQREELSRRVYAAASAGERVALRQESARAAARTVQSRLSSAEHRLAGLHAQQQADTADPQALERIESLRQSISALDRDRDAELARQLQELEAQASRAAEEARRREVAVQGAQAERQRAERAVEEARGRVREAERAVEAARRQAAQVGGELAAVNQFLRSHVTLPGGASTLADGLRVEAGLELALAAALDGRLRAAVLARQDDAGGLLARAGADGAIVLITAPEGARGSAGERAEGKAGSAGERRATAPTPTAFRLIEHVEGDEAALALARNLLADVWVVEELDELTESFQEVAVTRAGRVWHARRRELRQAPRAGEERVLEQRNRQQELLQATEGAARGERQAAQRVSEAQGAMAALETVSEAAVQAHRAAVRARDETLEGERRLRAQISRRRAAPDDGPAAARRAQLAAELAAESAAHERSERDRAERAGRIARLEASRARDRELAPQLERLIEALGSVVEVIAAQREVFAAALERDRQASAHVSAELKECAQLEAELQSRLHRHNEAVTAAEVALQRARDHLADAEQELGELARRLALEAVAAQDELDEEQREALAGRVARLLRRKEQLGPVNPLAQEEYAEALAHVEELERQRTDMETALRELTGLIRETDRQIKETFQETFTTAAGNFEELAAQLFPGGRGRLRLVEDREDGPARILGGESGHAENAPEGAEDGGEEEMPGETAADLMGVEIEITPGGKDMKRLTLLSGGEKSMTALAFLFAVFLARPCPFYILDEVEAALDDLNISRFLDLLERYSKRAQFIVVTHQKRTMEAADSLYGISMGGDGVSKVISRRLPSRASEPAGIEAAGGEAAGAGAAGARAAGAGAAGAGAAGAGAAETAGAAA